MSNRGSYIKSEFLKEIKGRLKFVSTPLADHLEPIKDPVEPACELKVSPENQECLDLFGLDRPSYDIIMARVTSMAFENELIAVKVKELMSLAKLYDENVIADQLRRHRQALENKKTQLLKADKKYQGELRQAQARRKSLTHSWEEVETQLRVRWRKILKGIATALSREELYVDLHPHDQFVINYLDANSDLVVILGDRVVKFDVELLTYIDIKHVEHVVEACIAAQAAECRGYILQDEVSPELLDDR